MNSTTNGRTSPIGTIHSVFDEYENLSNDTTRQKDQEIDDVFTECESDVILQIEAIDQGCYEMSDASITELKLKGNKCALRLMPKIPAAISEDEVVMLFLSGTEAVFLQVTKVELASSSSKSCHLCVVATLGIDKPSEMWIFGKVFEVNNPITLHTVDAESWGRISGSSTFMKHLDFNINNVKFGDTRKRAADGDVVTSGANFKSFPLSDRMMKRARCPDLKSTLPTENKTGTPLKSSDFFDTGAPDASKYSHHAKMFQVSSTVLQSQRTDHGKSTTMDAINQFAHAVTHGTSKGMNSCSIGNNGAESSILDIISVAPLITLRQSYVTATRTFLARRNTTVVPQLTKCFISEWSWPRDSLISNSTLLSAFSSLTPHYDIQQFQHIKSQINAEDWSDTTRLNYANLVNVAAAPVLDRSLEMATMAFENFILLLSILNNMRFKYQDALLRALYRTDAWLEPKLYRLGKKTLRAMEFITFAYGQLATELDGIMRRMANSDPRKEDRFLRAIECVPDTSEDSTLSFEFSIYFQAATAAKVHSSSLGMSSPPPSPAANRALGFLEVKPQKKIRAGKTNFSTVRATSGNPSASTSVNGSFVALQKNQQSGHPQQKTDAKHNGTCFFFNTTAGCTLTGCLRSHVVPNKDTDQGLRKMFLRWASSRNLTMTDEFLKEA